MESFLDPKEVLKRLKLRKDITAADFGSGSGGWAIPLAKKLEDGQVYAIDILKEPLSALQGKISLEKIENIRTIHSDVENKKGSTLPDSSIDLVLMTNLLFQTEDKKAVFVEAKRILKKGGELLVVDWKKEASLGPEKRRVLPEEVKKIAEGYDFKLEKELEAGVYHYALVFQKP